LGAFFVGILVAAAVVTVLLALGVL